MATEKIEFEMTEWHQKILQETLRDIMPPPAKSSDQYEKWVKVMIFTFKLKCNLRAKMEREFYATVDKMFASIRAPKEEVKVEEESALP